MHANRKIYFFSAYNDMLYLCEKYGPLDSLEKYDVEKDVSVTGTHITHAMKLQLLQ